MSGYCVFCGGPPETADHCPSKVLLEEPLPSNLPAVEACEKCNGGFSNDERYLACLVECVTHGIAQPDSKHRPKIRRLLTDNPKLVTELETARQTDLNGTLVWSADHARVRRIVLKLARGHVAYELSNPHLDEPREINFVPLLTLNQEQVFGFETPNMNSGFGLPFAGYPEIGSRAFIEVFKGSNRAVENGWKIVQPSRYRYLVGQGEGDYVHMVIGEYLACRVAWD